MAGFLEVAGLCAVVNDGDFLIATISDHLGRYFGAFDSRITDLSFGAVVDEENLVEGDFAAHFAFKFFNIQNSALSNEILFAAGSYNCDFCHIATNYTPFSGKCNARPSTCRRRLELLEKAASPCIWYPNTNQI
jgi:hypothetical protein